MNMSALGEHAAARRNHLTWIAPLVVFCAAVSYFTVFAMIPLLRDFPWLNLPLIGAGLLLSWLALRRARAERRGRATAWVGLTVSVLLAGLFSGYVFWLSYQLPGQEPAVAVGSLAPDFSLLDQEQRPTTLSEFRGRPVVLVFYRGHW